MKKMFLVLLAAGFAASCTNNKSATSTSSTGQDSALAALNWKDSMIQQNKALILSDFQALNSGDMAGAVKGSAPDAVDYGDGSSNPIHGADSIIAGLKEFQDAFPDNKASNFLVVGDLHHVAIFSDWTGTFTKPFMGMNPTHKSYKYRDVDLFTFNDSGQITEHHNIMPFRDIIMQVGGKMK